LTAAVEAPTFWPAQLARVITMGTPRWSLQDAKNRFSNVVDAALAGEPQTVTRRGRPAVVVVAAEEYARLRQLEQLKAPSFAEHLLAMPTDDVDVDRLDGRLREPGF
jgi:prevent-host-death family protein